MGPERVSKQGHKVPRPTSEIQPPRLEYISLGKEIREYVAQRLGITDVKKMNFSERGLVNKKFISAVKEVGIYFTNQELSSILRVKNITPYRKEIT